MLAKRRADQERQDTSRAVLAYGCLCSAKGRGIADEMTPRRRSKMIVFVGQFLPHAGDLQPFDFEPGFCTPERISAQPFDQRLDFVELFHRSESCHHTLIMVGVADS